MYAPPLLNTPVDPMTNLLGGNLPGRISTPSTLHRIIYARWEYWQVENETVHIAFEGGRTASYSYID